MSLGSPIKAERVESLLNKEFPPNPFWIEGILPKRGILLINGAVKVGKSLLALEHGRALSTATPLYGKKEFAVPQKARTLYIEAEVGPEGLKDRCVKVMDGEKGWQDYFYYVSQEPELLLDTVSGKQAFRRLVAEIKPHVLILDPMYFLFSGDENDNTIVRNVIQFIKELMKQGAEWDMSVIMLHHFAKPPNKKGEEIIDRFSPYMGRGSSNFAGAPDTIQVVHRMGDLEKVEWEAWELQCGFTCRRGGKPGELSLHVNEKNDLRVKFNRFLHRGVPKLIAAPLSEKPPSPPPVPGAAAAVDSSQTRLFDLQ